MARPKQIALASGPHLDPSRSPYVLYGVKYIDLVSLDGFQAKLQIERPPVRPVDLDDLASPFVAYAAVSR